MAIGNWIDRLRPLPQDMGAAAIDQLKGVRIAPNSNAIRRMLQAQQLKKIAGRFAPNIEEGVDNLIRKSEEFLGTRISANRYDPPKILTELALSNGPAHANKFVVSMPLPKVIDLDTNYFFQYAANKIKPDKDFKFVIQSASLPSTSISTNAVESPGPEVLMPYQVAYEDIALEMICTVGDIKEDQHGLPEKRFFDAWMANIIDPYSMEIGYREDYIMPNIKILVFGPHDFETPITIVSLLNCYPISMDAVELSHDNTDIMKVTVNIHYERWRYDNTEEDNFKQIEAPQPLKTQEQRNHIGSRPDLYSYGEKAIQGAIGYTKNNIPSEIKEKSSELFGNVSKSLKNAIK